MEKYIQKIIDWLIEFGGKLVMAFLILFIGFKIVDYIVQIIKKGRGYNKLEKSAQTFIGSILNIVLKAFVSITAITILGIPMTSIVALIGSFGLALGLALQGGLSNIAGGVMIMIFKPFKVGDFIDTHTNSGTVKEINVFHTVLETLDSKLVVLPNGNLSNSVIVNYTKLKYRKVDLQISVSYDSDIDKVKKILKSIADKSKYKLNDSNKETLIGLDEHSDSALIFTFRMWVNTNDYWPAKYEILEQIKKEFDKNKIEIPYPQMDVHLNKK